MRGVPSVKGWGLLQENTEPILWYSASVSRNPKASLLRTQRGGWAGRADGLRVAWTTPKPCRKKERERERMVERTLRVAYSAGENLPPQTPRPPSTNKVGRGGGLGPGLLALTPSKAKSVSEPVSEDSRLEGFFTHARTPTGAAVTFVVFAPRGLLVGLTAPFPDTSGFARSFQRSLTI